MLFINAMKYLTRNYKNLIKGNTSMAQVKKYVPPAATLQISVLFSFFFKRKKKKFLSLKKKLLCKSPSLIQKLWKMSGRYCGRLSYEK